MLLSWQAAYSVAMGICDSTTTKGLVSQPGMQKDGLDLPVCTTVETEVVSVQDVVVG